MSSVIVCGFRKVCEAELPGMLADAGCRRVDPLGAPADRGALPPGLDVPARSDIADVLDRVGDKTPPPFPGPDRARLLRLLGPS